MAGRPFNGLSGLEIRKMVLQETTDKLALDARFERNDPILSAVMTFTLKVDHKSAPANDPETFTMQMSEPFRSDGMVASDLPRLFRAAIDRTLSMDLRFHNNVVYPFVTWGHRLSVEVTRVDGSTVPETEIIAPPPVVDESKSNLPADRHVDLRPSALQVHVAHPVEEQRGFSGFKTAEEHHRAELQAKIDQLKAELDRVPAAVAPVVLSPSELRPHLVQPKEPDEMRITAGWKPLADPMSAVASSGRGAPMAIAVGHTPDGRQIGVTPEMLQRTDQVDIETHHPALEHGGIGAPDAARREAGLVVPTPQVGRTGQIVELPAGSF